ncbi:TPA: hypothetical protein QIX85_000297 [Serratia marcescens]|nr:hypothetical protein [Serratia marcescens]
MTQTLTTEQYTEGLCGDGAAILRDGVPMSVSEILAALNAADNREAQPVAWLAIYHGEIYDEAISITRSVVEAQADRFGWESALTEIIALYRHATPAPANAQAAGYFVRHRSTWDNPSLWSMWTECSADDYAEYCKQIATGEANAGRFFEARILYDAPPEPAAQDAVDIFADQIIGTKKQVIRIQPPIKNNKYGGSSYFYADDIIKTLELQGLIVLIDF